MFLLRYRRYRKSSRSNQLFVLKIQTFSHQNKLFLSSFLELSGFWEIQDLISLAFRNTLRSFDLELL